MILALAFSAGSFCIVPVSSDDIVVSRAEFNAEIVAALAWILTGKGT